MSRENGNANWIKRGRQRSAVFQVLRKPLTTSEICQAANAINPHIQLRDVWFIMEQFKDRGLAVCLNPKHVTGKLYGLTDKGRRVALKCYGLLVPRIPTDIDWRRYAKVARAKVRRLVLQELASLSAKISVSATAVKRSLKDKHPIGLNPTIRALKELCALGAAKAVTSEKSPDHQHYRLTPFGRKLVTQLSR
jgi:hypothetical protein